MKSDNINRIKLKCRDEFSCPAYLCYLLPFVFLGLYLLLLVINKSVSHAQGYYLIHYLYDYSHGFVARGLLGEVLSRLFGTISDEVTYGVVLTFSVLLLVSATLCIGKALSKVKNDRKLFTVVLILITMICLMPSSFRMYYEDIKLDKILWVLTLFAVCISDSKIGIWFVPILCVLATLVNPVFLFCSMILISIILLQKFYDSKYSAKNGIICAISYIAMIAIGLYGPISEKKLGFSTPDELINYYFSRYSGSTPIDVSKFQSEWLFDYFEPLDEILKLSFNIYFKEWGNGLIGLANFVFAFLPIYAILFIVWKKIIKNETNKFQKFIFVLCMISPIVTIPAIIISWESSKYFGNNVIVQLCLIVYYLVNKNEAVTKALSDIIQFIKSHLIMTAAITTYLAVLYA